MKKINKLNLVQVNTTAWDEEDFLLITTLTEEQIVKVITPIVMEERKLEEEIFIEPYDDTFKQWDKVNKYDNDSLVDALRKAYPNDVVTHYIPSQIDLISI
jgi:hypothetical protein